MSLNIFENGRSPEFIKQMEVAALKVRTLREKILRHEITLDEAARMLNSAPGWHAEDRSLLARGLPLEYCTKPHIDSGK